MERLLSGLLRWSVFGAASGYVCACFVWEYIYGIGSSVVTDDLHHKLENVVPIWGAQAGLFSGAASYFISGQWRVWGFALLQIAAVIAGMIWGSRGWSEGLIGFFGAHFAGIAICIVLGSIQHFVKHNVADSLSEAGGRTLRHHS